MAPQYSIKALKGLAHLRSVGNDIEIYVEDSSIRNAYNFIVRKFLPPGMKFTGVYPLGDKKRVIQACRNDQLERRSRRLYLVDGDLDLLMGGRQLRLKYFHRLKCYSFENALLNRTAILELSRLCLPGRTDQELAATFDLEKIVSNFSRSFAGLFVLFAIAHNNIEGQRPPTVSTSVFSLCERDAEQIFQPSEKLIRIKYRQLSALLIEKLGIERFRLLRRKYLANANSLNIGWEKIVAGKDYILRYVLHIIEKKANFRCRMEQLTVLLAGYNSTDFNSGFARSIRLAIQG